MSWTRLEKILIAVWLLYFLWPVDLLPDALGIIGRIDELLLLGYLLYRIRSERKKEATSTQENQKPAPDLTSDPYAVLGISSATSWDAIEQAYKKLATQYHPDKVNHLGPDLQKVAHEKMIAIQRAYAELKALHHR